jgi:uncharacterized protein with HEPN domain
MIKDPYIFIEHINKSIEKIESFLIGVEKEKFLKDDLIQSAVIRKLEIIGEAAKNLPQSFTKKYPDISWKEIVGLRDKLIHHYFGVDVELTWEVIKKDIPELKEKLKKIIK